MSENASIFSTKHFSTLLQVSQAILTLRKLDDLLAQINTTACELLGAERSTVYLYDRESNELYSRVTTELEIKEIRISLDQGVVGQVARQRLLSNISDAYAHEAFNPEIDRMTGFVTRNILTAPLVNRFNELVGVFQVLNKKAGPFTNPDEDIARIFSTYITIALENSLLYSQLEEAHNDLLQLEAMKNKFINIASHELLTPITILHGHLDLIKQEIFTPLTEDQRETLESMSAQIIRLSNRIRDIINISELEFELRSLEVEDIDLASLFVSIQAETVFLARQRSQDLVFHVQAEPGFRGDQAKIRQAVINLIMNAIRFTPDGERLVVKAETTRIVRKKPRDTFLKLTVTDTGVGMEQAELKRIFMTFYEVKDIMYHSSGTIEFQSGGLGLGLPITKKIVEHHQGWLEVQSQRGLGSTFTIFLPYGLTNQRKGT